MFSPKNFTISAGHSLIALAFALSAVAPWVLNLNDSLDLSTMLAPISSDHLLGTDNLGRDLLLRISQTITGVIFPLWLLVLLSWACGSLLSSLMLAFDDSIFIRTIDQSARSLAVMVTSIPTGIAVFLLAVAWEKTGLSLVAIVLGVFFACRNYLQMGELYNHDRLNGFWIANAATGGSPLTRILHYGIFQSWRRQISETLTFQLKVAVTIEAAISYLGFGVQEPNPSIGNMLASHFSLYMAGHWQTLIVLVGALVVVAQAPKSIAHLLSFVFRPGRDAL